jgi:hypothetical protein
MPREGLPVIICGLNEWFPRLAQGETFFSVHIVRMDLNLSCFPNEAFHASGFLGQDTGVIKQDVVTQVNCVLCHG